MPRLFTALKIPDDISMSLSLLQGGFENVLWIDRASMHITLRFIGDVDGPTADEIVSGLERIKPARFSLKLEGLDVFGGNKPRSLYACVKGNGELEALQASQERLMQRIGFSPEKRKFTPHVTLARINGIGACEVASWLSMRGNYTSESFDVTKFVLYSARGSVGGGPYVIEEEFDLS